LWIEEEEAGEGKESEGEEKTEVLAVESKVTIM
jgi:hypothetical protein